jgi:uncharacterized protein YciI
MVGVCLALATLALPQAGAAKSCQLVFLVTGPNTAEIDPAEQSKRMTGHLAGLRKMVESGQAYAAGPLVGAGTKEGITILKATSPDEGVKAMATDPWIEIGKLKAESYTWKVPLDAFHKPAQFMNLQTYVIAIASRAPTFKADQTKEDALIARMGKVAKASIFGPIASDPILCAVVIYDTNDDRAVQTALENDPGIKAGAFKVQLARLMISKGVFSD